MAKYENDAELVDSLDVRYDKTRRLMYGVIHGLDEVMTKRGTNRAKYRYRFIRTVGRNFDNLIDEVGAYNETEIAEQDERIEKLCGNITKLLAQLREANAATRAARQELEKAQKGPEKCPEEALSPNST